MYICSHILCVPILPVYLLSVSIYSCMMFIWDMKQTDVGRGVILKYLLLTTYIHFKKNFKNVSKMCSTKYDFNIPDLLCP